MKVLKVLDKFKFLICIVLGITIGLIFKEDAQVLKPFGTLFVNLILVSIVPLIFFSITGNIAKLEKNKKLFKILFVSMLVMIVTLLITGVLTTIASFIYSPYGGEVMDFETSTIEDINILDKIVSMLSVGDFTQVLSRSNVLPLIIFSLLIGISITMLDKKDKVKDALITCQNVFNNYLKIVMYYAPIGITAYLATLIGQLGTMFVENYARIIIMYLILAVINILVFHTIYLFIAGGFKMVKNYYKNILPVIVTAFSTQSSVATMPTNIQAMKKMGVSEDVVEISTPIMTLINMQGNIIQNLLKIFMMCGLFNLPIGGVGDIVFYIILSMFAGMITAGVPGGGVVSNTIIVSILGFPIEALPILIAIEWILDAPATVFNVLSDTATLPLVDKIVKRRKNADTSTETVQEEPTEE